MLYYLRVLAENSEELALQMLWDQWAVLGSDIPRTLRRARESLVDPEALILLTLSLLSCDHRLKDVSVWWAHVCTPISSVKRIRRLLPLFPEVARERMRVLAAIALEATKNVGWRSLARDSQPPSLVVRIDDTAPVDVLNPSSLIFRMRLIFGVNPTADVITYLLSRGNQPATAAQIGTATAYGSSSIYRVLEGLVAAKIVGRNKTRPASFMLCAEAWQEVLGRSVIRTDVRGRVGFRRGFQHNMAAPMWLCWIQIFSFLTRLREASHAAQRSFSNHRVVMRDVWDQFNASRRVFYDHRLMLPSLNPYGDQYIWSLLDNISRISAWYASDA